MKPDEIKSMLNCCATSSCDCCPYCGADDYDECTGAMAETALAYIQQLETKASAMTLAFDEALQLNKKQASIIREKANLNLTLLKEIQHLKRERDALLKDLRATDPCDNCKHCGTAWECDGDCSFCYHSETCQCRECDNDSHWEWAGIKEDNQ